MLEADVIKWWYVDENLPFRNKKFATVLSARNMSNVSAPGVYGGDAATNILQKLLKNHSHEAFGSSNAAFILEALQSITKSENKTNEKMCAFFLKEN